VSSSPSYPRDGTIIILLPRSSPYIYCVPYCPIVSVTYTHGVIGSCPSSSFVPVRDANFLRLPYNERVFHRFPALSSRPNPLPVRRRQRSHTHTHLYTYTCARSAGQRVSVRSGYITTKRARTIKYVIYSRRSSSRAPDAYYELPAKPVPSSGFARPEPLVPAVGSAHPGNHGVDGL